MRPGSVFSVLPSEIGRKKGDRFDWKLDISALCPRLDPGGPSKHRYLASSRLSHGPTGASL